MSRREVSLPLLALLLLVAVVKGFPTPYEDDGNSSGSRPFIEFTKGGIRVNFAGYHAQAGLGGLLTGRTADGGLHASAGTPTGAHASAGLGGTLDGGAAGGLHARAGLGNGGPEAEAGLGGTLAESKPRGEIFSRSSAGNLVLPQKTAGKNIQVIKSKRNDEGVSSSSVSAGATAAASSNDGHATVITDERSQSPARLYFQKRLHERVTQSSPYYDSFENAQAESASTATNAKETLTTNAKPSTPPELKPNAPGVFTRAVSGLDASNSGSNASNNVGYKKKTTLFDDIFNIPISALNAVNQLLKNHVGKK